MKKGTVKTILLLLLCAVGGLLIGFNAGKLSNGWNTALFVIGIVLVSMPLTIMGLLQTRWNRKRNT